MLLADGERPGTLGIYPEKQIEDPNWWDRVYLKFGQFIKQNSAPSLQQALQFADLVSQAGKAFRKLTDKQLTECSKEIRRILHKEGFEETIVARCFALIRELSGRKLGMRHFDVQVIGGWAMLRGMIAEMETGEGKTLTATLPACTAAMAGLPVHIITVNDYLVQRDAEWMTPVYQALGFKVGTITEGMDLPTRQKNYRADITYCTNKQVTFDYLKDRLVFGNKRSQLQMRIDQLNEEPSRKNKLLLRGLCFAIVDEADSVLVDEARTPLIISKDSGTANSQRIYQQALDAAEKLRQGSDYVVADRERKVELTDHGKLRVKELTEGLGGLWKGQLRSQELTTQALSALHLFVKDKHYLVQEEKVQIIDEYTGRVMADRSWERGLHQMIEAKEGCPLTGNRETLAKISYQQFFRRYLYLAGMTGTVQEVRGEMFSVYGLRVMKVPTNRPVQRVGQPMKVFKSADEKWQALSERVAEIHRQERPILIGTRSVEASELLSSMLVQKGLKHKTLNAKQDRDEAEIVKQAGNPGRITVATNMAGRGTDIKLASEITKLGGLHVIASEPHEARRIDRQLYGRCGRQGNPGSYELFFSFEDEVVKVFAPKIFTGVLKWFRFLGTHRLILYLAQKSAERHHAKIRYRLLKLDKQINKMLAFSGKSE